MSAIAPSASIYTSLSLHFRDFVVLGFSNYLAWRCPTVCVQLPYYREHLSDTAHLEIAVGTGFYPAHSIKALSKTKHVSLLDLNPTILAYARSRLQRAGYKGEIETLEHNVFDPLPESMRGAFGSISLYYLFHCLPGAFPDKARKVFANVTPALAPGGVVYGATILGAGVQHNWLGRRLMKLWNSKGVFDNTADSEEGLRIALGEAFEEYEVRVHRRVAMFEGRKPKLVKST